MEDKVTTKVLKGPLDLDILITLRSSKIDISDLVKLQQVIVTSVTSHLGEDVILVESEVKRKSTSSGTLNTLIATLESN